MRSRTIHRGWLALLAILGLAILAWAPAAAGDEKHQPVRGLSATFPENGAELQLSLLLANGDAIRHTYLGDDVPRIVRILELASRKEVFLFADLAGKELAALTVEFGTPPTYQRPRPVE